jgi:hypothetical protein
LEDAQHDHRDISQPFPGNVDCAMDSIDSDGVPYNETTNYRSPVSGNSDLGLDANFSSPNAQPTDADPEFEGNYSSDSNSDGDTWHNDSDLDSEFDDWKTYDEGREMKGQPSDENELEDQLRELEDMLDAEEYAELWESRKFVAFFRL